LDHKHFKTESIRQANLPITIMTPQGVLGIGKKTMRSHTNPLNDFMPVSTSMLARVM